MPLLTEADQISDIAFGYMGSKALFNALELGVFTALAENPQDSEALAATLNAPKERLTTLMTALAGLGLVAFDDGVWTNAPAASAFLAKGAKYDFGDYLRLQVGQQMYRLIDQIDDALAGDPAADDVTSYADWFADPSEARLYSESQHAGSLGPARQLAKSLDLNDASTLLDVGGGTGAFAITLCQRFENLSATIVEFPNVAALGREYVEAAGLSDRIRYVEGDGRDDIWPDEQDVVLMSYLFSGVPADAHGTLVERSFAHLSPGGRYVVHDFLVNPNRSGPRLAALWQLQHMAFTPDGRSLSSSDVTRLMDEAGFENATMAAMIPELTTVVIAERPA